MSISPLSIAQRARAAGAYRAILRSARSTFKDDQLTLSRFVLQTKALFVTSVLPSGDKFNDEIEGVLEVARYLRRNVVQAQHADEGKRLVLRMTQETELGDNESIKNSKPVRDSSTFAGCCSSAGPPVSSPSQLSAAAMRRQEQRRQRRELSATQSA